LIPIRDTIPSRSVPVVTWTLIAINALVFLFELSLPPEELQAFILRFGLVPARFSAISLFTCMFLHGGWMHVIGNMWTLWIFGDNVEDRMGRARFLVFYLLTGLIAGIAHLVTNIDSPIPTVGASGAIAGVLGAYFVLFPHSRVIVLFPILFIPLFFDVPAVVFLLVWFWSQLVSGALSGLGPEDVGGVAWWAHAGGFVAGALLWWLFVHDRPRRWERDERGVEGAWASSKGW
jgi:membrane associated rhomboid family serine protease